MNIYKGDRELGRVVKKPKGVRWCRKSTGNGKYKVIRSDPYIPIIIS